MTYDNNSIGRPEAGLQSPKLHAAGAVPAARAKTCSTCKLDLPVEAFNPNRTKSDGLQHECRKCKSAYNKAHYQTNKARYIQSNSDSKERAREYIRNAKANPCTDCGMRYPYWVMEFDHLSDKEYEVSRMVNGMGVAAIAREIAKCELVCANCHRHRTFMRRPPSWV